MEKEELEAARREIAELRGEFQKFSEFQDSAAEAVREKFWSYKELLT